MAGVGLIQRFHWIVYVFGAFLVYSGIKLFFQEERRDPSREESGAAFVPPLGAGDQGL